MLLAKLKNGEWIVRSFKKSLKHGIVCGLQNKTEDELNEIGFYHVVNNASNSVLKEDKDGFLMKLQEKLKEIL